VSVAAREFRAGLLDQCSDAARRDNVWVEMDAKPIYAGIGLDQMRPLYALLRLQEIPQTSNTTLTFRLSLGEGQS